MIKKTLAAIALLSLTATAGAAADCQVIRGEQDVRVCTFTMENSPACHKLKDYPDGPQQLADFYGAQVVSYKYAPSRQGFVLTIVRTMSNGKAGSIGLFHERDVKEDTEACIVAIGSQLGDPT